MKKTIYLAALFLIVGISAISCSKNAEQPTEKGNFFAAISDTNVFTNVATGSGSYSYGVVFTVAKNGKATELGCKMPDLGTYRVTLWDSTANRTILAQSDITVSAGGTNYASITAQPLTIGKVYLLTIQSSGKWYEIRKKGGGDLPYPISNGNIKIVGYQWIGSSSSAYPTNKSLTYIAGLCDLTFKAD